MPSMAASVLIVDDHDAFRALARRILEADGFEVVGEAADGASGVDAALALQPQIVLLDVQLPDIDGFAVAELLALAGSQCDVVMTSTRPALTSALVCGAAGPGGSSPRSISRGRRCR